jgi:hypothetical protein
MSSARTPQGGASRPRSRLRRLATWTLGLALTGAAIVAATPVAMLALGTREASRCVASYEAPRGPALPDCRAAMHWFIFPSRVPWRWAAQPASYRAEELGARAAIAAYADALIGRPDRAEARRAAEGVTAEEQILATGSRRITLEELGRAAGAPALGAQAALAFDRATLLASFDTFDEWDVRLRALEAALIEADLPRATAIAARYAAFDPRDEDLRAAIAGVLCLGARDEGERGLSLLTTIQHDRAAQRHEAWARDYGEVRAMIVACSARLGRDPPPRPSREEAGSMGAAAARAAIRLRLVLAADRAPALREPDAVADAVAAATALLEGAREPGTRAPLLAAMLAADPGRVTRDARELARLAAPRPAAEGAKPEPEILPSPAALTALDWLSPRRGLAIVVPPAALAIAAKTLRARAASAGLPPDEATALLDAADAMSLAEARALALAFDGANARLAIDATSARALPTASARALARSSAWYLAGEPDRALAEIDAVATESAALLDAGSPTSAARARQARAALAIQRADLLASLGRREEAILAAARATELAREADHHGLEVRAGWTRLALDRALGGALRLRTASAPYARMWPWVGSAGAADAWLSPEAEGADDLAAAQRFLGAARAADCDERRALRYAAFAHRGDTPIAPVAYYLLMGDLLRPDEGDVEVWLDAVTALDAHRLPLSTYAFLRAEAARARGDGASAETWAARYRALTALVTDPTRAELARALGI